MADWLSRPEIADHIQIETFNPVEDGVLCQAHDPAYVDGVLKCKIENGFGNKSAEVAESLRYTVGSMVAAAKCAIENRTLAISPTSGFHHAGYEHGGGYCTFNGLVIAALEMKRLGLVKRVIIIDGDAHFGDGTESCTAKTSSRHWIQNITARKDYSTSKEFFQCIDIKRFMFEYEEMREDIGSILCLYQAGADAWESDPLQSGVFTMKELERRDQMIFGLAHRCRVPLVTNLAGGYSVDSNGTIGPVLKIHRQTIRAGIDRYCHVSGGEE